MPSSDKLELILHDLLLRIFPPGDWDVNVDEIAQARAQIIDWALEIVPTDMSVETELDGDGGQTPHDEPMNQRRVGWNAACAELRAKLTEKRNGND